MRPNKSIFNYLLAALVAQGSYFILIPITISYFGEDAFAEIELFNVYSNLLFQILGVNICTAITKYKYESKNKEDFLAFSSNILVFGILISIFSLVVAILLILSKPNFWKLDNKLTAILPLGVFFLFSNFWLKNYLVTLKKVAEYRNLQILTGFLKLISVCFLIFVAGCSTAFGKVALEASLLCVLATFTILSGEINFSPFRFKDDILRALKFSSPLIIYVIVNNLLNYSDQIFISNYFDKMSLAIYSVGYRVAMVVVIFYVAISNYFSIDYYDNFKDKKYNLKKTYSLIWLLFVFSIIAYFFSRYYIEYSTKWSDEDLRLALEVNRIVILSYFINSLFLMYSRELFYLGKTFKISLLVLICALINISLNFLFLKGSGIVVAAYTTLLAYSILGLISGFFMLSSDRKNNLPLILRFVFCVFLLAGLTFYI